MRCDSSIAAFLDESTLDHVPLLATYASWYNTLLRCAACCRRDIDYPNQLSLLQVLLGETLQGMAAAYCSRCNA